MRIVLAASLLAALAACSSTGVEPLSISSPRLDSGVRGNGGGGLGGEGVVGKPTGAGVINRTTVP